MGQVLRRFFLTWLFVLGTAPLGCGNSNPEPCIAGAQAEDLDCDGVLKSEDNCPETFNPTQTDSDEDGVGDLCEPVPCGDGVCDPEGGECDVFDYCVADCSQSLCFGLAEGETCGDGICQPLAGECSNADPCLQDCPDEFSCFPGTCGDRLCQPWEDDPEELATFCFVDCICRIEKPVTDECRGNVDCLDQPGTVCGPEGFPEPPPGEETPDFRQIACECTTCGNTVLDPGEGCDISAGLAGVEGCFSQGGLCEEFSCECLLQELDCGDAFDNDGDGMTDCEDPDCAGMPGC
ncbi:hypothetical protein FBR05_12570 [Deltaproteobacteria bacterium PRO3]|nr:hypothetical protein [Deltaproteobacteria bacterium PRO3]